MCVLQVAGPTRSALGRHQRLQACLETVVAPPRITRVSGLLFTAGAHFPELSAVTPRRNFLKLLQIQSGNRFACDKTVAATPAASEQGVIAVKAVAAWVTLALIVGLSAGLTVGFASDRDEAIMTVQVSSSDHELLEGYFTLGDNATVMVKPGSDLYKFLSRHRGRKIKVSMVDAAGPDLSKLQR